VVSDVREEIGHPLDWYSMGAIDVSPSGNYILLTSYEVFEGGAATGTPITSSSRSALLRLTPKQD